MVYKFLMQCRFLLIEFLNITHNLVPYPLSNLYLRLFGIKCPFGSSIHHGCKFFYVGNITIGEHSVVNFNCYLYNRKQITIGNNVAIAHNTKIYTLGHNIDSPLFETKGAPVTIEDNVFVFSNALIMPGVTIGEGAIVLPGSVVTKDVPSRAIVGGNPAKIIRKRTAEIEYTTNYNYWFGL